MPAIHRHVRLIRWILTVVLPLLPLLATLFISRATGGSLDLSSVLGRGELLLVATTLAAAAAGELFGSAPPQARGAAAVVGVVVLIIAIFTALTYGAISHALSEGGQTDKGFVTVYSIVMYVLSGLAGAVCVALTERGEGWGTNYKES